MMPTKKYSIVIPAYNEEGVIGNVLTQIQQLPYIQSLEIIVVNDCSSDKTKEGVIAHPSVILLTNTQNFGYGYSLKRGITAAQYENIIILDADGSYPVSEVIGLIAEYEKGFDMVVGARQGSQYRGSFIKRIARICFRLISEFATGRRIPDINSGCRIFRKDAAMKFFHTLSSGFSFTTTITLAFMLNAYSVRYIPISYHKRHGHSKVKYVRDTLRSAQIIVEAIAYYNPLKLFILCAAMIAVAGLICAFVAHYISIWLGFLIFLTVALSVLAFALGLIAAFLRFQYNQRT